MLLVSLAVVACAGSLSAQERGLSFGVGGTANQNTYPGWAAGFAMNAFWGINDYLAAGFEGNLTKDSVDAFEGFAAGRFYLPWGFGGYFQVFMQGGMGLTVLTDWTFKTAEDPPKFYFHASAGMGARIPLAGNLFIEVAGRFGYPSWLGVNLLVGYQFIYLSVPKPVQGGGKDWGDFEDGDEYYETIQ